MNSLSTTATAYIHTPLQSQMAGAGKHTNAKAWAAAQEFESQFVSTMMQSMFEGIKSDGPFDGGQGEGMFRSLLVDQYGKEMSKAGGIGIADKIYGEILKLQEQAR
ncbi:rod-binding protein [Parvibaculum sp.]|uniref:rod-binding protein n=1 Tax=Parvibaculum sp. TaxID=2024848 RepID=UPI002C9C6BFE|nr:rod-binding protein [Parvibaculum sp.]HUD51715.1 rod-binding protein [Parvibaculum sp.]